MTSKRIQLNQTNGPIRVDQALLASIQEEFSNLSRRTLKSWFQNKDVRSGKKVLKGSETLQPSFFELEILDWEKKQRELLQISLSVAPSVTQSLAPSVTQSLVPSVTQSLVPSVTQSLVPSVTQSLAFDYQSLPPSRNRLRLPPSAPEPFLETLLENDWLLALHKPSGTASAPLSFNEPSQTAVHSAITQTPELIVNFPSHPLDPGLLYRLDNETSGVLLFIKDPHHFLKLKKLWKTSEVEKVYRAITTPSNKLKPTILSTNSSEKIRTSAPSAFFAHFTSLAPFEITQAISHSKKSSKKMVLSKSKSAKEKPLKAHTVVQSVRPLTSSDWTPKLSMDRELKKQEHSALNYQQAPLLDVTVRIHTGVRHQIRVHLASVGTPILGDTLYGGLPDSRLWLHCWKVTIPTPNGERLTIESPLPSHEPSE
jgi:23S rRNA-/tRNA-specific pseudouridylate synthase